jgi:hypothetical protein
MSVLSQPGEPRPEKLSKIAPGRLDLGAFDQARSARPRGLEMQDHIIALQRAKSEHHFPTTFSGPRCVEDAVIRLNPASTNLVEIRPERT